MTKIPLFVSSSLIFLSFLSSCNNSNSPKIIPPKIEQVNPKKPQKLNFLPLHGHWILACLLKLDTPLFPDQLSTVRNLCRHIQKSRAGIYKKSLDNQTKDNSTTGSDSENLTLNNYIDNFVSNDGIHFMKLIVAAVVGIFGQKDLSDELIA